MKRVLITLMTLIAFSAPVLIASVPASAADIFTNCGSGTANGTPDVCGETNAQTGNTGKNNPIVDIIKAAINVLSYIIGIAAIIGIVVSGIRLMTAGGDSSAVASARSGLIYSLIGIAVAVLAQVLVVYVLDKVK